MKPRLVLAFLLLTGCAAGSPFSATTRPYDPNLITDSRQAVANRWATDLDHRRFVEPYMNAICGADGKWAKMNTEWRLQQGEMWTKLWTFEPIPNAAPSGQAMDWSRLIEIIVGLGSKAVDIALISPPRSALPPGLPPC